MIRTRRWLASAVLGLALTAATSLQALAGSIFLTGDANISNPLIGSNGATANAGNQQFFRNILGSATNVAVLSTTVPFVITTNDVTSFYNAQPGVTASTVATGFSLASLAGSQLFVVPVPQIAFTAGQLSDILSYVAAGNSVFFLGENNNATFDIGNDAINAALAALGSSMSIVKDAFDAGFNPATIVADPLTAGVATLTYAFPSRVSGGTQILFGSQNRPFFAYETGGTSVVPVPASLPLLITGLGFIGVTMRRRVTAR